MCSPSTRRARTGIEALTPSLDRIQHAASQILLAI
jgi:hypothetical protein